jgi:beta-glucosidase
MEEYKNASIPTVRRVEDLIGRMTLREKTAQLRGIWVYEILKKSSFDPERAAARMGDGLGQITRLGGAGLQRPEASARLANEIQHYLVERTRLGIPALIHEEACSGYLTRGADVFPQALGVAASFDPSIPERMGEIIREQMLALGARQALAPLLDVTRDPRWGRTEETFGEDPYLASRMGVAYIKGLQGGDTRRGIVATGKHFVGYGASEGGMNWAPAHIPSRELAETYLYPFEVAVREGKLRSIMPGYHELDGVPCHTNAWLLGTVLREEWGFEGIVVSDYFGINMVFDYHHAAGDKDDAARMALVAGVDVELPSTDCYGEPLVAAVEKGAVDLSVVDKSLARVLTLKFELGLFDEPYVDPDAAAKHFQTEEQRAFSREAAEKSIVLLKNDGILPLSRSKKRIAVVGPNADDLRNMLGDYTYPAHVESLLDMKSDNFANTSLPDDLVSVQEELPKMDGILAGLRKEAPEIEFVHAAGCRVIGGDKELFAEALRAASSSDLVIAVMGDKAGLVEGCTSGEARDRASLDLPGLQKELLHELAAIGKPIILVLVSGRPLSLTWEDEHMDAIVEAWFPGEEGAAAVAAVLFGSVSPAGRTPISFPRSVGQLPVFYAHKPSGGRSHWKGNYVDESSSPLYAFGHGLGYSSFAYSELSVPERADIGGTIEVACSVANTGGRASEEVVQLYAHDLLADVTRPVMELVGFARFGTVPGEKKRITFSLSTEQLGFYDRDMNFAVESGDVEFLVGSSSRDIRLRGTCSLQGDRRVVKRSRYETKATVTRSSPA